MTSTEFASYVRYLTRTDSTTFPDSEIMLLANSSLPEICKSIEAEDEGAFGAKLFIDLKASATSREYSFPDGLMHRFDLVQAKLDGTKWVTLKALSAADYGPDNPLPVTEAEIIKQFSNEQGQASYLTFRDSIILYTGSIVSPASDASNAGFYLQGYLYPPKLTALNGNTDMSVPSSTTTTALDKLFHRLWAEDVAITYKQNKDAKVPLTKRELNWELNFANALMKFVETDRSRSQQKADVYDPEIGNGENL